MTVYCVNVWVTPGKEADFIAATEANHLETRKEPGNVRFDLLQSQDSPSDFFLYEVYKDDQAVAAHKETAHYKIWRETVEPWMAQKRQGRKYLSCVPQGEKLW